MWNKTRATELLKIKYPIIQGPFGGRFSSTKLVSAVSNLGGMGSFGLNAYGQDEILEIDSEIKSKTNKPYALNLWVPIKDDPIENFRDSDLIKLRDLFRPYFERLNVDMPEKPELDAPDFESQIEAIFKARPPVLSFIFGIPEKEIVSELKRLGIVLIGTATSLEEALLIQEAGLDLVVASGSEAGGHRASFLKSAEDSLTGTIPLLKQTVAHVSIPVITAGGIRNAGDIHKAIESGASAVQIGTAFLATNDSNASETHKAKLLSQPPPETHLTKVFTGRLARAISTQFAEDIGRHQAELAPYPLQSTFLAPLRKVALESDSSEYLAYWAGQHSSSLKYRSAESLFTALVNEVSAMYDK